MRSSMSEPARQFQMPYAISAMAVHRSEEERQSLALGLVDGAIVVIDMALEEEKYFLEQHPAVVTCLAFHEDRILMWGSVDGRVNQCDLDSENQARVFKCQNVMDQQVPLAAVATGEFGVAVDVEGNCLFYDFHRLR